MWVLRKVPILSIFLSTLSARRATSQLKPPVKSHRYFYPRSPQGERPVVEAITFNPPEISIHALRKESDAGLIFFLRDVSLFLSTLSARRATRLLTHHQSANRFLSTLSARRATHGTCIVFLSLLVFLSTLSARRATLLLMAHLVGRKNFYPRSPQGERPASDSLSDTSKVISIHALRKESDSRLDVEY